MHKQTTAKQFQKGHESKLMLNFSTSQITAIERTMRLLIAWLVDSSIPNSHIELFENFHGSGTTLADQK